MSQTYGSGGVVVVVLHVLVIVRLRHAPNLGKKGNKNL